MLDHDTPVSNAAARIAGAVLVIAAVAAGYAVVTYVPGPEVRLASRLFLYLFFGGTGLLAFIVGLQLIRSDEPELTLPPIVLLEEPSIIKPSAAFAEIAEPEAFVPI